MGGRMRYIRTIFLKVSVIIYTTHCISPVFHLLQLMGFFCAYLDVVRILCLRKCYLIWNHLTALVIKFIYTCVGPQE